MGMKAIVFDFGRVIADFDHMKTCNGLSSFSDLSPKEIHQKIFKSDLEKDFDQGKISPFNFYQKVKQVIKASDKLTFVLLQEIWGDIFIENPGIETIIKKIEPGIKILLLSNTNQIHWRYISQIKVIKSHFAQEKNLVLSFQIGCRKPDLRIFQEAILRCGNNPTDIIYVDDIPEYVAVFEKLEGHGIIYNCRTNPIEKLQKGLSKFGVL